MFEFKDYSKNEISSPPQPIIGVDERFIFQEPLTLYIDEKSSISGDDFIIKDSNEVPYFNCKGILFSFNDKKVIYDTDDKPVLNIQEDTFVGNGINIYAGYYSNTKLGKLDKKSIFKSNKYVYKFTNLVDNCTEELDMKCDISGNSCGIFYGKEKEQAPMVCNIVKIKQNTDNKKYDHYCIKIAPNVDVALMVALTICFDELKHESEEK
ncbi:hypothetical protein PIROE2DRAFT_69876 [Piromyces sp. E2]|nr:hypothetical protein PIROE2DRAFT_69876 [Piromyces sp. E2]|eukprot:OUM59325.1 hypothetical protein PIROE2DRAFT_69876 [Piromyces sp. E2]